MVFCIYCKMDANFCEIVAKILHFIIYMKKVNKNYDCIYVKTMENA